MKWWGIVLLLLLGACSRIQESTQVFSDDVPSGVAGKLLLSDESDAINTSVYLLNEYGVIIDSVVTNLSGEFFFEVIPDGSYEVFARASNGESGWVYSEDRVDAENGQNFILDLSSSIAITIEPLPDSAIVYFQVAGLPYYEILEDGEGVLNDLPQGRYEVLVFSEGLGKGIDRVFYMKDTIELEEDTVKIEYDERYEFFDEGLNRIDDFEHDLKSEKNPWGSAWWHFTDKSNGGSASLDYLNGTEGFLFTDTVSQNKSMGYSLTFTDSNAFAGMGLYLSTEAYSTPLDLREIKNIQYLSKGSGAYSHKVCLASDVIDSMVCSDPFGPTIEWTLFQTGPVNDWLDGKTASEESLQWVTQLLIVWEARQENVDSGTFLIDGIYLDK
ncbi:MAG: carboxypeptidase-like regulatory domain-containing protein [Fibrobacterales bacterium]